MTAPLFPELLDAWAESIREQLDSRADWYQHGYRLTCSMFTEYDAHEFTAGLTDRLSRTVTIDGDTIHIGPIEPDINSLILLRGARLCIEHDGHLPDGYTLRPLRNGRWHGKHPRGDIKSTDGEWVEGLLWCIAEQEGHL